MKSAHDLKSLDWEAKREELHQGRLITTEKPITIVTNMMGIGTG